MDKQMVGTHAVTEGTKLVNQNCFEFGMFAMFCCCCIASSLLLLLRLNPLEVVTPCQTPHHLNVKQNVQQVIAYSWLHVL